MRFVYSAAPVLLLSGALSASAQTAPLSALPPAPFTFVGKWACQGSFRAGKLHEATFTGEVLGGKWIELDEVDTVPATGYAGKYLIGFDPEHSRLVEFDANSFAAATYSSSDGWVGSVLTMTSPVSTDPKVHYALNRFIYSIAGQDASPSIGRRVRRQSRSGRQPITSPASVRGSVSC